MSQPLPPEQGPLPYSVPYRVAGLSSRKPNRFDLKPDAETRAAIAAFLDITAIKTLRFSGMISPKGRHDFVLEAALEAEVEQPCCVSLAPVRSHLREDVLRVFLADYDLPEAAEMEMPEDDTSEPLGEVIDAGHVLLEALALALPPFPKAEGATLENAQFTAPGAAPLRDDDLRPFAGLAALKAKLENPDDGPQGDGS
ncbi:DUF177 domain-containing protein [Pseudorhodobacter sp. E13]|uniref:YceD family protein n=1 Tax=Pseudorhodobacter sp. E13 TaxID=2487931 RepID=UPI000F8ED289|nr:YceD family protein [Pseudorhodobacter sp. E13]RUS63688.1 DUF177 domain-containing protein [Pseudorhodobacter sp. E13]